MSVVVVIPSGGAGKRFGGAIPKQYQELGDRPVITRTMSLFEEIAEVEELVIACAPEWREFLLAQKEKFLLKKPLSFAEAGRERQYSVYNALQISCARNANIILIHDAVRPFTAPALVQRIIAAAGEHGAAIPVRALTDTVKEIDSEDFVTTTHARGMLRSVQTPQGFQRPIIMHAYENAARENFFGTDDSSLVEFAGYKVKTVAGEDMNIKITTPLDRKIAAVILNESGASA